VKSVQQVVVFVAVWFLMLTPAALPAGLQEISIPAGTVLSVRMIDSISSDTNQTGEVFHGTLDHSVQVGNRTVLPRGARVRVKLTDAESAGRVKGRSKLNLQLQSVDVGNQHYPIASNVISFRGKSEGKKTAKKAGIGAAVGGGLGALFGGGKGAAIGAGLGAGTGVATNAMHEGEQVYVDSESLVQFRLSAPLRIHR